MYDNTKHVEYNACVSVCCSDDHHTLSCEHVQCNQFTYTITPPPHTQHTAIAGTHPNPTSTPSSGMHTPSALHKVLLLAPHTLSLMQSLLTTYGCTSVAQDCIDTLQAILRVCAVNTHAELTKVNVQENSRGRGHARGMGRGALLAPWRWKLNRSLLQDAEYGVL